MGQGVMLQAQVLGQDEWHSHKAPQGCEEVLESRTERGGHGMHLYSPRQKGILPRDGHPWPKVRTLQLVLRGVDSEGQAKMQACS